MPKKFINFCKFCKKPGNTFLASIVLTLFFFALLTGLCSASDFSTETREWVLDEYYSTELIKTMLNDSASIVKHFGGINIFSSAQYGDKFLVGEIDFGDIFDARNPINRRIFRKYARDNIAVLNVGDKDFYNRYAMAADKFLEEFQFDAVIFFPDEFHPVFTTPQDSWIFVREIPWGNRQGKYNITRRVRNRRFAVEGGIKTKPLKRNKLYQYYIPKAGASYEPYKLIDSETIQDEPLKDQPKPITSSMDVHSKRIEAGIIPSYLSGKKNIPVGLWTSGDKAMIKYKYGLTYKASNEEYTWGDRGFYLIPLHKDFWK